MTEALLLAAALFSTMQFGHGRFVEGVETTVFAEGSAMLSDSTPGAAHLADLPAGLPVVILEASRNWCLVEVRSSFHLPAFARFTGWVEAEALAPVSLQTSGGLFQFGITGSDESGNPTGEARLHRDDGVVLSCLVDLRSFSEGGRVGHGIEASEVAADRLSDVETAIVLSFVYEACGYLNSDILIVATADRLVLGPAAGSVSEAGLFSHIESLVLPPGLDEENVVEIMTVQQGGTWEGDPGFVSLPDTSVIRYSWNGRFFDLEP